MNFTRKSRFVANGSDTEAPVALTYSSAVSRESVQLEFLIKELNDFYMMACDIGNVNMNAYSIENMWFKSGLECGEHLEKVMILVRALYGLKISGASWRIKVKVIHWKEPT